MTLLEKTLVEKYPILAMTEAQVKQLWLDRQAEAQAKGLPFYTKCVDPITDEVWIEFTPKG